MIIDNIFKVWLFPARLVQVVTAFGWFLTNKPKLGGSLGFSGLVLTTQVNIIIHLLFACFGLSYWELCSINSEVEPVIPYLLISLIIGWPLIGKYIYTDNCIKDLEFTYSSITNKLLSLLGFVLFVLGMPALNYFIAILTLEPWY